MRIDMQNMITIHRASELYLSELLAFVCIMCAIDKIQKSHQIKISERASEKVERQNTVIFTHYSINCD